MSADVIQLVKPLDALAQRIRGAYERTERGRQEWIDGTLDLAAALADARSRPLEQWIDDCDGGAVKMLDPNRAIFPPARAWRFIWLDRDFKEQAKSQLKLMAATMPGHAFDTGRRARAALARSYATDRTICLHRLHALAGTPSGVLMLRLEQILAQPLTTALRIGAWLDQPFDASAAADVVLPRSARCYPGMLEVELLRRKELAR